VESKDTLQRVQVARAADLDANASRPIALVRESLRAFGLEAGVRVATQTKVPAAAGLGVETALAVALVGALARATGRHAGEGDLARLAVEATRAAFGRPAEAAEVAAAIHGGCVAAEASGGTVRLPTDPAALEECLLLVDAGPAGAEPDAVADSEEQGARVRAALAGHRFDELAAVLGEAWDARGGAPGWATAERSRVAGALRPAGAGLRACGGGRGSVVAVVAAPGARGPGPREAVLAAAREAALRVFPARVDLRGLDVEKTA
jgi:hypothetical protein